MRKLLLALTGAMLSFYGFADLGEIKVNSYLSQPLNATIPITGISEAGLSELAIGLASSAKFKNNGISFSPELGSLQFKIINSKSAPYLQITSSRALSAPVLKILLHYKQNNDDFYRQYTLLLDPIEVNDTVVSNSNENIVPVKSNREVVMHKISGEKPIAVSNNPSKINSNLTAKNSFVMDLTNPYVMQRLANFDQKSMTYTTTSNDNLYAIARFEQLIYSHALFNLNQIIIALGLENYPKIKPLGQSYESGVKILLPLPQDINLIQSALADQYLLGASLSSNERLGALRAMAAAFDVSLKIESVDLFAATNLVASAVASKPVVKKHFSPPLPVAYEDKGLIDTLLEYKYYLGLGLILAFGLLLLNKKIKLRAAQNKNLLMSMPSVHPTTEIYLDEMPNYSVASGVVAQNDISERDFESSEHQDSDSQDSDSQDFDQVDNSNDIVAVDETQSLNDSSYNDNHVDEELINTLEYLLSFDDSRDDIRFKLLELYLSAGRIEAANLIYAKLDQSFDSESSLRNDLMDICTRYSFVPNVSLAVATPEIAASKPATELMFDIPEPLLSKVPKDLPRKTNFMSSRAPSPLGVASALNDLDRDRVMNFTGSAITAPAPAPMVPKNIPESVPESVPEIDLAADTLRNPEPPKWSDSNFHVINSETYNDTLLDEDDNLDEKLNLAQMYYQIEEAPKAREILIEVINASIGSPAIKAKARQLLVDLGLNG